MPTCKVKKITVPDYGDFYIRRASMLLQSRVSGIMADAQLSDADKNLRANVEVLSNVLVDETGLRLYGDARKDELQEWDMRLVSAIMDAVRDFNRDGLDDAIKNSEPSPGESQPSE